MENADLPKSLKVTFSEEEIGEVVGLEKVQVSAEIDRLCSETADLPKSNKVTFFEEDTAPGGKRSLEKRRRRISANLENALAEVTKRFCQY